jgi:hypothetical protein
MILRHVRFVAAAKMFSQYTQQRLWLAVGVNSCPPLRGLESTRPNNYLSKNTNRFLGELSPQKVLLLISLLLLFGTCLYWAMNLRQTSSVVAKENVCISATVKTGSYEMPAFNTASFRALSAGLKDTNFTASCAVGTGLELRYAMTFNAQKTSWQAEMVALDKAGNVVWQGAESAAIQNVGAFQYTTESTAEKLLERFLSSR